MTHFRFLKDKMIRRSLALHEYDYFVVVELTFTFALQKVQYEQYLEENFTQWQKRLKDIRDNEKSKVLF